MSVFTSTMAMANTSLLSDLYDRCTLWTTPHTVVGEEGRVEVTLPSLKHISSVTPIRVNETTFSVWTEFERSCELHICLYGKVYTAILGPSDFNGYDDIKHVVTIAGKEVVDVTADTKRDALTPNFSSGPVDLTNYDSKEFS